MASAVVVTLYDQQIPGVGTAHLKCIATLVSDAAGVANANGLGIVYLVEVTNGTPSTQVQMSREDFLAIRALKAMV